MSLGPQSADWLDAARLLRRTGFGTTGAAVDAAVQMGRPAYLKQALAADPTHDPGAIATPAPTLQQAPKLPRGTTPAERKAADMNPAEARDLIAWWIRRMVTVEQPLGEKLTFCWHNHFATSMATVRAFFMLAQNQKIRALARGSFHDLAQMILTDAAMLYWLDGEANVVGGPNENLGREFMELFILGHGDGYTETDVREGSRALTGWVIDADGSTRLVPKRHDYGLKTFLGATSDLDDAGYCHALLARSASAPYVANRLYGQLAADSPPSAATTSRMAAVFRPDWDISAMLTAMLLSDDFVSARNQIVVGPVDWLIGAARALKVNVTDDKITGYLANVLRSLGQLPFYPPDVGGWPAGSAWLSTAAADVRMRASLYLAQHADLGVVTSAARST
ncbi:MAG: DUF1800 domain-containing protein, partial [Lacisediminihabitans sp.]